MTDVAAAARLLAGYAKGFGAGAFATPSANELRSGRVGLREWTAGPERTVAVTSVLRRPSRRADFTGATVVFPAGTRQVTHVARTPAGPIPSFAGYDVVYAYREDRGLADGLAAQGRTPDLHRVTAAGELITGWGYGSGVPVGPADRVTLAELPETFDLGPLLAEVAAVDAWHDDFPFYSDGSWSAVSLRGFRPDDPRWGVKPSEMPRSWQAEHPESLRYVCDWTVLAERCPAVRAAVEAVPWWSRTERVRLLRMAGTGDGHLGRHTDITDRAAGTRVGQIARFHVPLVTDPRIVMRAWSLEGEETVRHLQAGHCYYLDARKPHAVDNPTTVDRVHLVVDVVVDLAVRARLAALAA